MASYSRPCVCVVGLLVWVCGHVAAQGGCSLPGLAQLRVGADASIAIDWVDASGAIQSTWLSGACAAAHVNGTWLRQTDGSLSPGAPQSVSGEDAFGAFTGYQIVWTAPASGWSMVSRALCYADAGSFLFDAQYPSGANGTATYPSALDAAGRVKERRSARVRGADFDGFNVSYTPVAQWPCFDVTNSPVLTDEVAYAEWAGEFLWHQFNFGTGLESFLGGQLSGVFALLNASESAPVQTRGGAPAARRAMTLGIASGMKHTIFALVNGSSGNEKQLVAGPHGHLDVLPVGYMHRVAVTPSTSGLTPSVYAYGQLLRDGYGTTRPDPAEDIAVSRLSAWTDNGCAISGASEWAGQGAAVMTGLAEYHRAAGIPVATYQLDPWWYPANQHGGAAVNWSYNLNVFGTAGLQPLVDAGMKLTLYSSMFAAPPDTEMPQFDWVVSEPFNTFFSGPIARAAPNGSYAFYSELMRRGKLWNMVSFEIDFTDFNYFEYADELTVIGAYDAWIQGLSDAARDAGVSVQLCMALPSDALQSVQLSAVSNIRASDDNDFQYAPPNRWTIGRTSLLLGALDIRPFFDGLWTTSSQPNPYSSDYAQNFTELSAAIAILSTGPLGLGDGIGYTNISLVNMTCRADGVLLKPSFAEAPIDSFFNFLGSAGAEVYQSFSLLPQAPPANCPTAMDAVAALGVNASTTLPSGCHCPWAHILSVDTAQRLTLFPADLTPALPWNSKACRSTFAAVPWSPGVKAIAARCSNGAPALACAAPFNSSFGVNATTGPAEPGMHHVFKLFSIAPFTAGGWALLGELHKFVRVSPQRFAHIDAAGAAPNMTLTLNGAVGEATQITLLTPGIDGNDPFAGSITRAAPVTFTAATATIRCSGAGAAATCVQTE